MIYLFVHHKVENYMKWKMVFDEHASARKEHGSTGARVLRNMNDPQEIIVISDWSDKEKAQTFANSPGLREAMERAGVMGMPEVIYLEETDRQAA